AQLPGNVITRALGVTEALDLDLSRVELCLGDRLLLCTDGLHGLVGDEAIAALLRAHADPDDACAALVIAAESAGGHDNITVLVATLEGGGLGPPPPGRVRPAATRVPR